MRSTTRPILLLLLLASSPAFAHPLAPTLLELRELGDGRVAVSWKMSLLRVPGADVAPVLPARCRNESAPTSVTDTESVTRAWIMACGAPGLVGERVGFRGLGAANIDGLVRVALADGRLIRGVVNADQALIAIPEPQRALDVARVYARRGIAHILGGVDHLLFVAGLLVLARGRRSLIETIAAFSLGHSLTLSLAVLDILRVPSRPIEFLIALSVFLLAVELARDPAAPPSLLRRHPWLPALGFGLLHGLGFANALRDYGLPPGGAALALGAFNLGIELGLLAFVGTWLAVLAALRRLHISWPRWTLRVPLYTMGSLAAFWCFERSAALVR